MKWLDKNDMLQQESDFELNIVPSLSQPLPLSHNNSITASNLPMHHLMFPADEAEQ